MRNLTLQTTKNSKTEENKQPSSPACTKASRKSIDTKQRILRAAQDEFAEKGPQGARVDAVARRAGVSKERIYAHVGNKDCLFQTVLEMLYQEIKNSDDQLMALTENDLEHLELIILNKFMSGHEHAPHFWRLLAWENLDGGQHIKAMKPFHRQAYDHLRKLYQTGQNSGIFQKDVHFETFILLLTGVTFFYHSNEHTMSHNINLDLSTKDNKHRFIHEVARMLRPPKT